MATQQQQQQNTAAIVTLTLVLLLGLLPGLALYAAGERPLNPASVPREATVGSGVSAYLKGAIADVAGDPERAQKAYLAALADDPDNLSLRQRVMELAMIAGDVDTAIRLAKTLPESEQSNLSGMLNVLAAVRDGDMKQARKHMRKVAKTAPGLLQFEVLQAYLDYADGMKVLALVQRLQALPLPKGLEGRRQYHSARLWLKDGKPDKALLALEKAQKLEPQAIFTTMLLSEVYVQQAMPEKAAKLMESFRESNPAVALILPTGQQLLASKGPVAPTTPAEDLASGLFDFGLVIWAEGALAPARQLMNMALWLAPEQPYIRYYAGVLLEMGGDWVAAERAYAALLGNPVLNPGVRLRLAEVTFKNDRKRDGWRMVNDLVADMPDVPVVRRSLAQMAFELEDYGRAADEYARLLALLGEDDQAKGLRADLLFARGAALERARRYREAEQDLQLALALSPANAQVMNYLGYMWVDRNENLEVAYALLRKAHLLAPEDGAITDSLGWAYYRKGEYETARKYLEIAAEQDSESAEIMDHLGDAYAKLGRPQEALKYWRLALELVDRGALTPYPSFRRSVERKVERAED